MIHYNVQEVFDKYEYNDNLLEADIFHLYDTGQECITDNSGYHDSRHFELVAFNTKTMEKRHLGTHDGILSSRNDVPVYMIRVYADGSFFIRFKRLAGIEIFQNIELI